MVHVNQHFWTGVAIGLLLFYIVLVVGHEIASHFDSDTY